MIDDLVPDLGGGGLGDGAFASEPGSREPSPEGLGPPGFDPSRWWAVSITMTQDKRDGAINIQNCLCLRNASSGDEAVGSAVAWATERNPNHSIFCIAKVRFASTIEARSDETRSGSAEGESPVRASECAQPSPHSKREDQ